MEESRHVEARPEDLFAGFPEGLALCGAVERLIGEVGEASMTVSKSQLAFRRRRGFAYVWRPGQYLHSDVPAVLSIALPYAVESPRFKSVAHPSPGVWMHHLELRDPAQLDAEVAGWLAAAHAAAG